METVLSENVNTLSQQQQSWDEIKRLYPDEWVLVGNPIKKENEFFITSGIPLYHANSKQQVSSEGYNILERLGLKNFKIVFTGEIQSSGHYLAGIFSRLP